MIRAIMKRDIALIRDIHAKNFGNEFSPDEIYRFTTGFAAVDENDRVIIAAGIQPIMEAVMIMDKEVDIVKRREAGMEIFDTIKVTTRLAGYEELHCFIQDEKWMKHLIRYGFKPTKGKSLVIGL